MKNSINISVAGEDLLSTADDGTNRLFINGAEIPSASWTGSGNYTATVSGHAITIAKVADASGNVAIRKTAPYTYELYKIKTGTTIDGDLEVTGNLDVTGDIYEGGQSLAVKYGSSGMPLPTVILTTSTSTSSYIESMVKSYTVNGSGFLYISVTCYTSTNNDYGTFNSEIRQNGTIVAKNMARWGSNNTERYASNASCFISVSAGDAIRCACGTTKTGTSTGVFNLVAFGCTLT